MRVLFRVAAALLIANPVLVVLIIICALSGNRGIARPLGEQGFPLTAERSLAWLLAARKRIDYQRLPLVASAYVPGALPTVVVRLPSAISLDTNGRRHEIPIKAGVVKSAIAQPDS